MEPQQRFTQDMNALGIQKTPEFFDAVRRHMVKRHKSQGQQDDDDMLQRILFQYSKLVIQRSDPSKRRMLVLGGSNRPERPPPRTDSFDQWRDPTIYANGQLFDETFVMNNNYGASGLVKFRHLTVPEIVITTPSGKEYPIKGLRADFNLPETWRLFPDNFFDLIVFDWGTIRFFQPNKILLLEIVRTLKPRGYFYVPPIKASLLYSVKGPNGQKVKSTDDDPYRRIPFQQALIQQGDKILSEPGIKGAPFWRVGDSRCTRLSKNNFINRFIKQKRQQVFKYELPQQKRSTKQQVIQSIQKGDYPQALYKARLLPKANQEMFFQVDNRIMPIMKQGKQRNP